MFMPPVKPTRPSVTSSYEQFAVIAHVHVLHPPWQHGAKESRDLNSPFSERAGNWRSGVARPDSVDQHANLNPAPNRTGESSNEHFTGGIVVEDICAEGNSSLCRIDRVYHGGKGPFTVHQWPHAVSARERPLRHAPH
jgi:hypothetical protein